MILTKMTAVGTDGTRVTLWFDDGTRMKVSTNVVVRYGLYQGMELDEETLAQLLRGSESLGPGSGSADRVRRQCFRKGVEAPFGAKGRAP